MACADELKWLLSFLDNRRMGTTAAFARARRGESRDQDLEKYPDQRDTEGRSVR